MKVQSFIREKNKLVPVEVELTMWPGLPTIQFLGLPDQHLKESALRIKSAIKSCGFKFPQAQQILVNLRPSHLKKTSRGLELAVAVAYLWETEQIPKVLPQSDFYIYGELGLTGEVAEPDDLTSDLQEDGVVVLTGKGQEGSCFRRLQVESLQQLPGPVEVPAKEKTYDIHRPNAFQDFLFTPQQAEILKILAVGQHSALLAGPSGSGKTTIAKALHEFLPIPTGNEFKEIHQMAQMFCQEISWRPSVQPHHSTPVISMIGGGNIPAAGEISRAHGGVLILDELLEFSPVVIEALRGPMEIGKISVARKGTVNQFSCQSLIVATTNLCPCGSWTPEKNRDGRCGYSLARCRSYALRLSGPILDRFEILMFSALKKKPSISGREILESIHRVWDFQAADSRRKTVKNSALTWLDFTNEPNWAELESLMPVSISSQRRRLALLRVARTIADLQGSSMIRGPHLQEAMSWAVLPFEKMAGFGG